MQVNKSFRASLLLMIAVIVIFIAGSFVVLLVLARNSTMPMPKPNPFIARVVYRINPDNPAQGVAEFEQMSKGTLPVSAYLYDSSGNVIFPAGQPRQTDWEKIKLPQAPFEETKLRSGSVSDLFPVIVNSIVKLPTQPPTYLVLKENTKTTPPIFLITAIAVLIGSIFLGVGFSLYYIFRIIRFNLIHVDQVMGRLKSGDLKARIEIKKMNEVGSALIRFNQMADEIELLVENLRKTERSRTALLQELAHDLRTPIASLKTLLSNLQASEGKLPTQTTHEIFDLSLTEVSYLQRLVEDLLFLAQMSDPSYRLQPEPLKFSDVIESVVEEYRHSQDKIKIVLLGNSEYKNIHIGFGDEHLLKRFFKNAIGNAVSFSEKVVRIDIVPTNGSVKICIVDDGPGFTKESLKSFGERRITRVMDKKQKNRVSIGLGSVIMKTIAELHRGTVTPTNETDHEGNILGGKIEFELPLKI